MSFDGKIQIKVGIGEELSSEIDQVKSIIGEYGQKFDLKSFILKKANDYLGLDFDNLNRSLWVSEDFSVEKEGDELSFKSIGNIQYLGLQTFLFCLQHFKCYGRAYLFHQYYELFDIKHNNIKHKLLNFDPNNDFESDPFVFRQEVLEKEIINNFKFCLKQFS